MRLTTFTDYSLRLLIYLAAEPDQRATIGEVAAAFGISEHHLVKVVHLLGKEGILINTRGKGGGLELAEPPASINVGRVVRLTEGAHRPAECFDRERNTCVIANICRLPPALVEAMDAFYAVLDRYSLEDLKVGSAQLNRALLPRPTADG